MIYGLLSGKSCYLTEIARKLNEDISLDKTVERLSRNLMNFEDAEKLSENYFQTVEKHFDNNTVLIVDDGDVAKKKQQQAGRTVQSSRWEHRRNRRRILVCRSQRACRGTQTAHPDIQPNLFKRGGRTHQQKRGDLEITGIYIFALPENKYPRS